MALKHQKIERNWQDYYNAVRGRPPRHTLITALENFENEDSKNPNNPPHRFAVDLGCGEGRDTVELLRRGWRVLAIDGEAEGIERMWQRNDINKSNLETKIMQFEALKLPRNCDLINASFCLPFCPPQHFSHLWEEVVNSLSSGGRFCGQLFGERDSWAIEPNLSHHTRKQVENLVNSLAIEMLEEEEHPGKTALGESKYWHIFHLVIRKN
jgi:SAM-dependent methyltransferase